MRLLTSPSQYIRTAMGGFVLSSLIVGFLCTSFIHVTPAHADMGSHTAHKASSATLNACCDVGVNDHMELWKSTLVGIPQGFQDLLVLIVLAVATSVVFADFLAIPRLDTNIIFYRYQQYAREHPDMALFDPLRLAFARGILHPKTF